MSRKDELVVFSSLPSVGGHTTTTLKLCELLAPNFARTCVLAKAMPGHGFSQSAAQELARLGVQVLTWKTGNPIAVLRPLLRSGRPHTFLAIGMRHLSPVLAVLLRPRQSFYYHITHELSPPMRRQLAVYARFFTKLVFLSPATWNVYRQPARTAWALQPTGLPKHLPIEHDPSDRIRLGFLGRLNQAKGLGILLDFVQNTERACELHIAGAGDLEPSVRQLAGRKEAPGRVVFHGSFEAAQRTKFLQGFFSSVDTLCAPSIDDREGIPNVILEALQCGVPSLVTATGGMRSFALPELGPAPRAALRIVEPSLVTQALEELVAGPPPDPETRETCLRYFREFFADNVVRNRWREILRGAAA